MVRIQIEMTIRPAALAVLAITLLGLGAVAVAAPASVRADRSSRSTTC